MPEVVDARGLPCPQPVLLLRKALAELGVEGVVTILVDHTASLENVKRFSGSQGCEVVVLETSPGEWELTVAKGFTCPVKEGKEDPTPQEEGAPASGDFQEGVVYIHSATIGRGDDELGRVLMHAYLGALKEVDPLPKTVIFVNSGVKLTTKGSEWIEEIEALESRGVQILSCGTCLDFFGWKEALEVGRMTNIFEMASILQRANRIVTP